MYMYKCTHTCVHVYMYFVHVYDALLIQHVGVMRDGGKGVMRD